MRLYMADYDFGCSMDRTMVRRRGENPGEQRCLLKAGTWSSALE